MPQCENCQTFVSHSKLLFYSDTKCVKCNGGNNSLNCPKSKKTKAKGANCGEELTSNWNGCFAYEKSRRKSSFDKTKITVAQRIQQKPAKRAIARVVSFAQMKLGLNGKKKKKNYYRYPTWNKREIGHSQSKNKSQKKKKWIAPPPSTRTLRMLCFLRQ